MPGFGHPGYNIYSGTANNGALQTSKTSTFVSDYRH